MARYLKTNGAFFKAYVLRLFFIIFMVERFVAVADKITLFTNFSFNNYNARTMSNRLKRLTLTRVRASIPWVRSCRECALRPRSPWPSLPTKRETLTLIIFVSPLYRNSISKPVSNLHYSETLSFTNKTRRDHIIANYLNSYIDGESTPFTVAENKKCNRCEYFMLCTRSFTLNAFRLQNNRVYASHAFFKYFFFSFRRFLSWLSATCFIDGQFIDIGGSFSLWVSGHLCWP